MVAEGGRAERRCSRESKTRPRKKFKSALEAVLSSRRPQEVFNTPLRVCKRLKSSSRAHECSRESQQVCSQKSVAIACHARVTEKRHAKSLPPTATAEVLDVNQRRPNDDEPSLPYQTAESREQVGVYSSSSSSAPSPRAASTRLEAMRSRSLCPSCEMRRPPRGSCSSHHRRRQRYIRASYVQDETNLLKNADLLETLKDLSLHRARRVRVLRRPIAAILRPTVHLCEGADADVLPEVDVASDGGCEGPESTQLQFEK